MPPEYDLAPPGKAVLCEAGNGPRRRRRHELRRGHCGELVEVMNLNKVVVVLVAVDW